jgi:hypothetical protein
MLYREIGLGALLDSYRKTAHLKRRAVFHFIGTAYNLAPSVGLEPTTQWLTATCSAS